jgi:hypothetical protein
VKRTFLVKLRGLLQELSPPTVKPIGFSDKSLETGVARTLTSWNLWLVPNRLADYRPEDFPHLKHLHPEIESVIRRFEHLALRGGKANDTEKKESRALLLRLADIFGDELSKKENGA